jgi:hypothetical protein
MCGLVNLGSERVPAWLAGACSRLTLHVVLAGWFLAASGAMAHEWYPVWCCSDRDCRALSQERGETVLEASDGWHLWDGRVVSRRSGKPSPDSQFHLCEEPTTKAIICFFVPPGSS